eukprot:232011-Chlamydomonas_euryale.AAC.2
MAHKGFPVAEILSKLKKTGDGVFFKQTIARPARGKEFQGARSPEGRGVHCRWPHGPSPNATCGHMWHLKRCLHRCGTYILSCFQSHKAKKTAKLWHGIATNFQIYRSFGSSPSQLFGGLTNRECLASDFAATLALCELNSRLSRASILNSRA